MFARRSSNFWSPEIYLYHVVYNCPAFKIKFKVVLTKSYYNNLGYVLFMHFNLYIVVWLYLPKKHMFGSLMKSTTKYSTFYKTNIHSDQPFITL